MITPTFLRWMYNMTNNATATGQSLAVVEFLDAGGFALSDLESFSQEMDVPPIGPIHTVGYVNTSLPPGLESALDLEYAASFAYGANLTYWSEEYRMLAFAQSFFTTPNVPQVGVPLPPPHLVFALKKHLFLDASTPNVPQVGAPLHKHFCFSCSKKRHKKPKKSSFPCVRLKRSS
jgi:hypothetical protein